MRHDDKVDRIAGQLQRHPPGAPLKLRKGNVSHQVPMRLREMQQIDVSTLDQVLEVDPVSMTCTAEPGVTFERLVEATLPYGLTPIVVPELKGITVGGAVAGCSLESTSFRYGGFHDTCVEYEVLTALGERLTCTPGNEHALLFQMQHGAFGTLGIITRAVFRLMPARPFVHLVYDRYASLPRLLEGLERRAAEPDIDFIDGFAHAPDEAVLCVGRFVDEAPYTNRYDRGFRAYFRTTRERREDFLTTPHYFFRYDRGVTRVFPLLSSTQVLWLAQRLSKVFWPSRPNVTVDLFLPLSRVERFFDWYRREMGFFPLWLVPYRRVRDYEWLTPGFFAGMKDTFFLDVAIYGMKQPPGRNAYREIEQALDRVGGIKTLISHNYYSPEEFWRIWNEQNHRRAKERVDPDNVFGDLYAKTVLRKAA